MDRIVSIFQSCCKGDMCKIFRTIPGLLQELSKHKRINARIYRMTKAPLKSVGKEYFLIHGVGVIGLHLERNQRIEGGNKGRKERKKLEL